MAGWTRGSWLIVLIGACSNPPNNAADGGYPVLDAAVVDATTIDAPEVDAGLHDGGSIDAQAAPVDAIAGPDANFGPACNSAQAWLVFRAWLDTNQTIDLYGTYVTSGGGGTAQTLNQALPNGGQVRHPQQSLAWSPDGTKLVYYVHLQSGPPELWLIDLSSSIPGTPVKISGYLEPNGSIGTASGSYMAWSPDSTKVAYYADQSGEGPVQIFVVDVSGSSPTVAQSVQPVTLGAVGDLYGRLGFRWSPDSNWILYRGITVPSGEIGLYVTNVSSTTPGAPIPVNAGGATETTTNQFEFSPDGLHIAYVAKQGGAVYKVFMASIGSVGPSASSARTSTEVGFERIAWAPDSSALAYQSLGSLWLVGPSMGPVQIAGSGGASEKFQWAPVLPWLAFRTSNALSVVWAAAGTPGSPQLVGSWAQASIEPSYKWSRDGNRLLLRADSVTPGVFELFVADIGPSVVTRKISGTMVAGGDVTDSYQISPDGRFASYRADQDTDDVFELFAVDIDQLTPTPLKLNLPLIPTDAGLLGDVGLHAWSPDSTRIAYTADQVSDGVPEVWLVDVVVGPSSIVQVNPYFPPGAAAGEVSWTSCASP